MIVPQESNKIKYSAEVRNGYNTDSFKHFNLPNTLVSALVGASNQSLAASTWSSYNTAKNHIHRYQEDTGVHMSFPMDDRMVLAYVGWLIAVRKVSSATISQYISGLRVAHLKHGVMSGNLKPALIAAIIKGKEHEEGKLNSKIPRLAMTIPVMKLLKALLMASNMTLAKKRLI